MIEQSDLQKDKQKNIDELIDRLSENQNYHKDLEAQSSDLNMLASIYKNDYRHDYSEIYRKLTVLFEKNDGSDTLLSENLKILKNRIEQFRIRKPQDSRLEEIIRGFTKLIDHISLEINRYLFLQSQFASMRIDFEKDTPSERYELPADWKDRILQLESENETNKAVLTEAVVTTEAASVDAEKATIEAKTAGKKAEMAKEKAETASMQAKEASATIEDKINKSSLSSITSLSIFSAVILAVSGGITFEAGVFNGIEKATPFRLVFIVALTGFVLISVIFILLYIIAKITGSNIETNCIYWRELGDNKKCLKKCGDGECIRNFSQRTLICKTVNKYAFVFVIDAFLILVMYYDFFLWFINSDRGSYNWLRIFLFIAPFIIPIAAYFVYKAYYYIQLRYTKISYLNKMMENYLEKDEDNQSYFSTILSKATEAISHIFSKMELSEKQNFEIYVNDILLESTDKNDYTKKGIHRLLKKYVHMHFPLSNKNWPTISTAEHNRNRIMRDSYLTIMKDKLDKLRLDRMAHVIGDTSEDDGT